MKETYYRRNQRIKYWQMKLLLSLWVLFTGAMLLGQSAGIIRGTVKDAGGNAMIAVNISANKASGTISDANGAFSLILQPGEYLLEFFYVGYISTSRKVILAEGQEIQLDIVLEQSKHMLDEVVVTAGKYEQKLSEVTVSMEVLKPQLLSDQNITSLDDIMEKTSGISVLNGQMSIRGGSGFSYGVGSRVLMLIDDMPMISGDAGDIKWNYMPVENVNQVEIIKGASSALYGSSALNGVINLRTRFPGNEPRTEITTFSGMYMDPRRKEMIWWDRNPGFLGTSFSHLRKIGRLDLSLGGNYYKNEGYRELEHEDRIRGNLGLRYTFEKVKGLSAGLNMSAMHLNVADFLFWQNADSGAYRQNPDSYAPLVGHRYNIDPYLEYHNSEGDRHSLRTRLYSVGNANLDESFSSFSKIWYADYRYLNRIGQYFNWTNGFSFMRNTVRAGLFDEHMGSNSALYSQLDAQPFDRLKMSAGIRWEVNTLNNDLFIAKPVARAGLNFQLGKASFLRASFGQGYRFPSVAEMFAEARLSGFKIFGNPELGSETGWSAEMGIKQGFSIGSVNGYLDLAAFWTEYQDMIEYTFGYYPPDTLLKHPSEYVGYKALNIENARIMGAEISAIFQGKLGPVDMYVTAGYTFMDPVDPMMLDSLGRADTTGYTILKYRRKHLFKSDLSLKFKGLSAGVNLQYNSRMIRVDEAFIDWRGELLMPGFPDYWANKAGDYLLVDLRLGWEITPAFRISAILKNAGNNEYLGRPGDIGPPRNITLQAKFTF